MTHGKICDFYNKLMLKFMQPGTVGNIHNWIENWLSNRKRTVVFNGSALDWASVTSGIPHGSVLGPVFFIMYINKQESDGNIRLLLR